MKVINDPNATALKDFYEMLERANATFAAKKKARGSEQSTVHMSTTLLLDQLLEKHERKSIIKDGVPPEYP